MHETNARKILCFLVVTACAITTCAQAKQITTDQKINQINKYCFGDGRGSFDGRKCLADRLQKSADELKAAIRKRDFEIDEIARKPKAPSELSGQEEAEAWRSAFKAEQEAWDRYRQRRCQNVQEFENYPGNGAWATQCSLRLTLERLREIVDGY